ncbi:MAG: hypothetical protein LUH04_09710 [Clostridium sp.]|nr:hypothetical protein [Clostridium sp.]
MRRGESYFLVEGAEEVPVSELLGKMVTSMEVLGDREELRLFCSDRTAYFMYHEQCCCESVRIEDICGELEYLLDSPILLAEEARGETGMDEDLMEHYTWTFYKFATKKGYVTLRWLGTSNGYYGEEVSLIRVPVERLTQEGWVRERPAAAGAEEGQSTVLCRIETEEGDGNCYATLTLPAWSEQYGFPSEIEVSLAESVLQDFGAGNLEEQAGAYLRTVYLKEESEAVIENAGRREVFWRRLCLCQWKVRMCGSDTE